MWWIVFGIVIAIDLFIWALCKMRADIEDEEGSR